MFVMMKLEKSVIIKMHIFTIINKCELLLSQIPININASTLFTHFI